MLTQRGLQSRLATLGSARVNTSRRASSLRLHAAIDLRRRARRRPARQGLPEQAAAEGIWPERERIAAEALERSERNARIPQERGPQGHRATGRAQAWLLGNGHSTRKARGSPSR